MFTLQFLPVARNVHERYASGCLCTHYVVFVRYTQTTSGCVLIVLERYASGWRCSVEARVDASGVTAMRRLRMSADWRIVSTTLICNAANCARRNHDTVG